MWSLPQASKRFWAHGGDVIGACALAASAIYFLSGRFTTVRFDQERIDVEVKEGLIHVHGLYHYRNTSRLPAVLTLGIPFPVDHDHPAPEVWTLAEVHEDGRLVRGLDTDAGSEKSRACACFSGRARPSGYSLTTGNQPTGPRVVTS